MVRERGRKNSTPRPATVSHPGSGSSRPGKPVSRRATPITRTRGRANCGLCTKLGWVEPRWWYPGKEIKTSSEVLAVSARKGCGICRLLSTVFEPFEALSSKPLDIEYNLYAREFSLMYWKPEFDSWDQKFQDIGRSIRLHLLTDKGSIHIIFLSLLEVA